MKPLNLTNQLTRIEEILKSQNAEVMDFEKTCDYLNVSKSFLYKLTCKNRIPFYKPNGKKIYFEKGELNKWLLKNRIKTSEEIDESADKFILKNNLS